MPSMPCINATSSAARVRMVTLIDRVSPAQAGPYRNLDRLRHDREVGVLATAARAGEARLISKIRPVGDDAARGEPGDVRVVAEERRRARERRVERGGEPAIVLGRIR